MCEMDKIEDNKRIDLSDVSKKMVRALAGSGTGSGCGIEAWWGGF